MFSYLLASLFWYAGRCHAYLSHTEIAKNTEKNRTKRKNTEQTQKKKKKYRTNTEEIKNKYRTNTKL